MGIGARVFFAFWGFALAGSVGVGSVASAETNWQSLSGADWSALRPESTDRMAEAGMDTDGNWGAAIQQAFVNLGMAEARAECFGHVLAKQLSPEGQRQAAQLVSEAASADEVKIGVISGGPEMVGGFSAADASCPENMGG